MPLYSGCTAVVPMVPTLEGIHCILFDIFLFIYSQATPFFSNVSLQHSVAGIPNLHLPDVCAAAPAQGKAFCIEHCKLLEEQAPGIPTGVKEFMAYCRKSPTGLQYVVVVKKLCCNSKVREFTERYHTQRQLLIPVKG